MAIALANDDVTNSLPRRVNGTDSISATCDIGGPTNVGTYTPAASSLLIAVFGAAGVAADPDGSPPVQGHGVTYTKIESQSTTGLGLMGIWAANSGGAPTSAALSVAYTATTAQGWILYDLNFTGVDLTSLAGAFVQKPTNSTAVGATSLTTSMAAASAPDNRAFVITFIAANQAITEDSSYAEVHDQGHNAPTRAFSVAYNNTSTFDTTVLTSWSSSVACRQFAIELKASGGAPAVTMSRALLGVGV